MIFNQKNYRESFSLLSSGLHVMDVFEIHGEGQLKLKNKSKKEIVQNLIRKSVRINNISPNREVFPKNIIFLRFIKIPQNDPRNNLEAISIENRKYQV